MARHTTPVLPRNAPRPELSVGPIPGSPGTPGAIPATVQEAEAQRRIRQAVSQQQAPSGTTARGLSASMLQYGSSLPRDATYQAQVDAFQRMLQAGELTGESKRQAEILVRGGEQPERTVSQPTPGQPRTTVGPGQTLFSQQPTQPTFEPAAVTAHIPSLPRVPKPAEQDPRISQVLDRLLGGGEGWCQWWGNWLSSCWTW